MTNLTNELRLNGLNENEINRIRRFLNGNGWSCKDVVSVNFRTFCCIQFVSRWGHMVEYTL